jgi:aromatic-L-amino-acid decarboxylase
LIRGHLLTAQRLAGWIDEDPNLERMADVNFSTVVFRHVPAGVNASQLDEHNARVLERVNATRQVYLSHTRVRGSYALRVAIGNVHTTEAHVRRALDLVREAGSIN